MKHSFNYRGGWACTLMKYKNTLNNVNVGMPHLELAFTKDWCMHNNMCALLVRVLTN